MWQALRQLEEVKKQAEINASFQLSQRIELKKMFEMHKVSIYLLVTLLAPMSSYN